ncbi:MAG: phage terminase large subunit [Rikenellaceae bacterium]
MTPMHQLYYTVLEHFAKGRIKKLIITMPPQHGKSHGATVLLPSYILGLNPDLRLAIASYSASLATKFNRRIQRIIESKEYGEIFPETRIKTGAKPVNYIRTSDEFDILYREGSLLSVGREGSLTGNRVDCFILDDLYKDAMEANSPLVRENCVEWYTSVVKTRMHNTSQEMMVFTRWHEEDLIGVLTRREPFEIFTSLDQIEHLNPATWLYLNFEAIKSTPPSTFDPREIGEALWPERQNIEILQAKRALDPLRFECMYQGNPTTKEGLLYGDNFTEYERLPQNILKRCSYTDTADLGDDYLCSICYVVGSDHLIYITDVVYSREPMEITEPLVAGMFRNQAVASATIESNNGGRGFARAVQRLAPEVKIEWFHQSANKQARILSNSATVVHRLRFPPEWQQRWSELAAHLTTYRRSFRSNRWHDAADVVTGIIEQEQQRSKGTKRNVNFL